MYFNEDRCIQCNGVRLDFTSQRGLRRRGGIQMDNDSVGFCSDACYDKAIKPFLQDDQSDLSARQGEELENFELSHSTDNPAHVAGYKRLLQRHHDEFTNRRLEHEQAHFDAKTRLLNRWHAENTQRNRDDFAEQKRRSDARLAPIIARQDMKWERERQEREAEEARLEAERLAHEELIRERPIPERFRSEHTLVLGGSGAGKTTLLQEMILNDLATDDPPAMVVIDPKGLMIDRIKRLDVFNPDTSFFRPGRGRLNDRIIIVDPTQAPALNMFDTAARRFQMYSDTVRRQIENQAISNFAYIFSSVGSKLTDKQSVAFTFVVHLLFSMKHANIHTLVDVLDARKDTFAADIGRLDDISRRFFANEYFTSNFAKTRQEIKARLFSLLMRPEFVDMFSAPVRKLDMFECLQERKIVLVNTAMGVLGPEGSQTFGRYIISLVLNAAFARIAVPRREWNPAYLIIDEFQEYADELKTPELLRLAREYNLGVVMATQVLHGPPFNDALRNSISTNTAIKYAAAVEAQDLAYIARDMRCKPEFIMQRKRTKTHANFACYVRNFLDHPMSVNVPLGNIDAEPQMTREAHARLLRENRRQLSPETYKAPEGALHAVERVPAEADKPIVPPLTLSDKLANLKARLFGSPEQETTPDTPPPKPPPAPRKSTPPATAENEPPEKW